MKLESIEHARFRALAQITIDKEKGVDAFEEYMKVAFPYLEAAKARDKTKFMELLNSEVKRGALAITPVGQPNVKSRLKTRIEKRRKKPLSKEESNKLYRKIEQGKSKYYRS